MNVIQGKTIAVREVETYGVNAKPLSPREIETCGVNAKPLSPREIETCGANAKPLSPKKIDFCEMNVKSPANVRAVVSNAREPRLQQIVPIEPEEKAVNQAAAEMAVTLSEVSVANPRQGKLDMTLQEMFAERRGMTANNITDGKVQALPIKPLKTHAGEAGRRSSITSFDDMLKAQGRTKSTKTSAVKHLDYSADTSKLDRTGSSRTTSSASGTSTGQSQKTNRTVSTGSTSTKKTTSASSMKTTPYDSYFKKAAKKYRVSESLLKAIAKAESNFNERDVSSSGAMGVMQLMPDTARGLGVEDPFDPEQNIMGGAKCIASKLKEYNGDVKLALAAYNAGSGTVRRVGGIPSQCRSYIKKVLSYQKAFETAKKV